ncbi:MAG: ATP-binding protein [Armatimonadota bacterium]|nr:ATP-binding protein [Armatimonadota bacterium]MDR5696299.1 ATP-binding protein [Armatimonadota bacterium]
MGPTAKEARRIGLRAQLTLAFAIIAIASVGLVAAWAQYTTAQQFGAYMERVRRGEVTWIAEQPPHVRELFLQGMRPATKLFRLSQRKFLKAFNQSLWLGGATAAGLAVAVALVVAGRLSRPLAELQRAARGIASGNLDQVVRPAGGEIGDVAEAFNAMAARLRANERMRQELLAAVAHELRTPLSIIQANLESFLDGVSEPTPERIAALHTQSALLSRLITDLRDLSLAEAGQLALRRAPTDVAALCRESVEVLQPWIEERGVAVEVSSQGDTVVDVDADRIRQVIQNLLHNAVRFTPSGGTVAVRATSRSDGDVEVVVDDGGPGIPHDELPRIFEPFHRADPSRSRASGGSGLGLAVVRHLVHAHGGTVRAHNRPEVGARFVLTLPRRGPAHRTASGR